MNAAFLNRNRRWLFVVVVATWLALSATYAPLLLGEFTGTVLTPQVYACQNPSSGGCG